jgi:hypothetical protein
LVSSVLPANSNLVACKKCSWHIESAAKFCGNCGTPCDLLLEFNRTLSRAIIESSNQENHAAEARLAQKLSAPSFARQSFKRREIPADMKEEMTSILTLLLRERLFLIMHCVIFLVTNLIGLAIAFKCYLEFNGDELSKLMIASTPLLFINLVALMSLVPIKGTKKEIARLKERLTYLKLRIEYDGLM